MDPRMGGSAPGVRPVEPWRLTVRLALLTGGSRGLGRALCCHLEAHGYRVIEFSRSAPHAFSSQLDLRSPPTLGAVAESISSIDPAACEELVVISNAGTLAPIGPAWGHDRQHVFQNLNVNLVSAIGFIGEVVRHFRGCRARKLIINVSSGAALKGYAGWSLYCAAKAGMENFIRAVAVEEQRQECPFLPISVDPGVIDTDMQALIRESSASDFPDVERFRSRKESGGLAEPDAVARAIIALAARHDLKPGARYEVESLSATCLAEQWPE